MAVSRTAGRRLDPVAFRRLDARRLHLGGGDFPATAGASVRMVMDVGAWDNSVAVNSPGQSGDPFSAHYRDLFPLWAAGDYFPLVFSDAAVSAAARDIYDLTPAPPAKAAP